MISYNIIEKSELKFINTIRFLYNLCFVCVVLYNKL